MCGRRGEASARGLLVLGLCALWSCDGKATSSEDAGLADKYEQVLASSKGDGVVPVTVYLSGVDTSGAHVTVSYRGMTQGMDLVVPPPPGYHQPPLPPYFFTTVSAQQASCDADFEISVVSDVFAPMHSTFRLPCAFAITPLPASVSRSGTLDLTWDPPDVSSNIYWNVSADPCIDRVSLGPEVPSPTLLQDTGRISFPAGTFDGPGTCTATLGLTREHADGTLDPAFRGGSVDVTQQRVTRFSSAP